MGLCDWQTSSKSSQFSWVPLRSCLAKCLLFENVKDLVSLKRNFQKLLFGTRIYRLWLYFPSNDENLTVSPMTFIRRNFSQFQCSKTSKSLKKKEVLITSRAVTKENQICVPDGNRTHALPNASQMLKVRRCETRQLGTIYFYLYMSLWNFLAAAGQYFLS